MRSTAAASVRRRRRATSWRCSDRLAMRGGELRGRAEVGVARERRLEARDVEAIFRAFAEVMRELPPDTEAGWLATEGDLRLAPDIGRKLRTAPGVPHSLPAIPAAQAHRHS